MNSAIAIFNDPRRVAYLEFTHNTLFRAMGEYEWGYDTTYDEIALALACVAVEMAVADDLYELVPAPKLQLTRDASPSEN